jgi:uncharacterized protein (TIGR00730 family)
MKRICLFCGSSPGRSETYRDAAAEFGRLLASEGIGLVYGGASVGLMTIAADAALEAGGEVIGVIPEALAGRELAHRGLTQLHIVGSMHERKALMAELSDGFVSLPGGLGTFEEFFEVITWALLGFHRKPCGLISVDGYYTRLLDLIDHAVAEGFVQKTDRDLILVSDGCAEMLQMLRSYRPPQLHRWIDEPSEL